MRKFVRVLALCCAAFLAGSAFAHGEWPAAGRIVFEVLRGEDGVKLGESEHRWRQDGKTYEMSTVVQTTGLAGLLYDFRYTQRSAGAIEAGRLVPARFSVVQQDRPEDVASFDWSAGEVEIARRARLRNYPLARGDQDVLSVWHLFAALNGKEPPETLQLVTNRGAYQADITIVGSETASLDLGELPVRHVKLIARSGRLAIDVWLSEAHGSLPVRVLMRDDRGQVLDQRAIRIETGN